MELDDRLQRTGSLIESDPYELLLKYLGKNNLDRFTNLLDTEKELNINHYYGEPDYGTLLDLCSNRNVSNSKENSTSQFVHALMSRGADPNIINPLRKKAPIHFIVEKGDTRNLSKLLEFNGVVDVNISDNFGNTPLHIVAKGLREGGPSETSLLQMLLNVPEINVNAANRKGQTPVYLAASQGTKDTLLLLTSRNDIDLDGYKDRSGKSARDLIEAKFSDILLPSKLLISLPLTVTPDYIFSLLRANNIDLFKKALEDNVALVNASDGMYTLLQYGSYYGFLDVVDFLIKLGADVNKTNTSMQHTSIMLASTKGYYQIVQRLLKSDVSYRPVNMETVFHCVVNGSVDSGQLGDSEQGKDHSECLDILLNNVPDKALINVGDSKGNTPLHYAGRIGKDDLVFKLLEAGAYVGCTNAFGDPALAYITPSLFEKYLDKCVRTNEKQPREEGYEIIINYKCFVPPSDSSDGDPRLSTNKYDNSNLNETDLLLYSSKSPDMKHLLMHPVIKSLIYMKWYSIQKWFYVNLLFYVMFWALLSVYVLGVYDSIEPMRNVQVNITDSDGSAPSPSAEQTKSPIWYFVVFLLILLIARELFQFKKAYVQYLLNCENWLEVGVIVLTISILFVNVEEKTKHQLAASAILFSWTELVLLIGKHPALSTHIEMLKTVAWNFLKFLAWYSILIVAFALSFYTLFRNGPSEENTAFNGPVVSIFKTIVMLTGEFEAGEIPFDQFPITSHMLFVLFVFAIAIVLYNLLNGLAVSDTQAIMADAEMVGYVSRIKLVSYVETIDPIPCKKINFKNIDFSNKLCGSSWLACNKNIFTFMTDNEIHIFPNDMNKIDFSTSPVKVKKRGDDDPVVECCLLDSSRCKHTIMDSTIVKSAQILLNRKQEEQTGNVQLLQQYRNTLEEYKNLLKVMCDNQKRLMNTIDCLNVKSGDMSVTSIHSEF